MSNPYIEASYSRRDARTFERIARSHNRLTAEIGILDEDTLLKLFRWELDHKQRLQVLNKVKALHNRLRDARERHEAYLHLS